MVGVVDHGGGYAKGSQGESFVHAPRGLSHVRPPTRAEDPERGHLGAAGTGSEFSKTLPRVIIDEHVQSQRVGGDPQGTCEQRAVAVRQRRVEAGEEGRERDRREHGEREARIETRVDASARARAEA